MKRYALYEGESIVSILTGTEETAALQGFDYVGMPEGGSSTHYINDGEPTPKLEWECEPVIDGLSVILPGVPDGTTVRVNGTRFAATGDVTLTLDSLEPHQIVLIPPASYVEKTIWVRPDA